MVEITVKAPAKVILSGEHSVVYGKPAIVSAIDRHLTFSITKSAITKKHKKIASISKIVTQYLTNKKISFSTVQYDFLTDTDIPVGYGLGSSAALCVAAVAAFLFFYTGREFDKEIVNNLAFKAEKLFHANPSGVDNSTSTFGGLIFFRREFEFLKTISALSFKIPKNIEENLYLINSGKPDEKTKEMVNRIGENYNINPLKTERIFNDIEKTTKQITVSLVKEDASFFKQAIAKNQTLLTELGVVSNETQHLLKDLGQFGVGKITGAGGVKKGSGFILFFAEKKEALESYLKKEKIDYFKFKQSHNGYSTSFR